jgi:hypothetical protein
VEHLGLMLERIAASAGSLPDVMTLDAGYWSDDNAIACSNQGNDASMATGRLPHGQPPHLMPWPLPKDADAKNPHGSPAQKQGGLEDLRSAQGDRGASERADQGRPGPAALPVAGPGEGRWRVAPDRGHAQPALAAGFSEGGFVPVQAI